MDIETARYTKSTSAATEQKISPADVQQHSAELAAGARVRTNPTRAFVTSALIGIFDDGSEKGRLYDVRHSTRPHLDVSAEADHARTERIEDNAARSNIREIRLDQVDIRTEACCLFFLTRDLPDLFPAPARSPAERIIYSTLLADRGQCEQIIINSREPVEASRVHEAIVSKYDEFLSPERLGRWIVQESEFRRMRSIDYPALPLVELSLPGGKVSPRNLIAYGLTEVPWADRTLSPAKIELVRKAS